MLNLTFPSPTLSCCLNTSWIGAFSVITFCNLAPDGVPQHCSVWHYNSSAIVLSVGKPERLLMNGLIHYEVVVRNQFGDEITRTLEQHGDITTTVFSNLTKFMYHNISIRAATVKGPGPEFMIYNRTLEDGN